MCMYTRLFYIQFFLVLGIASVHILALSYDLYFYIWQFDTPMHIAGGLWVYLTTHWLVRDIAGHRDVFMYEYIFLFTTVLYVGVGWEVFEIATGIIGNSYADLFDSSKDILMDLLGATAGAMLLSRGMLR
jgi:uncharacterized membrane protein YjdF